MQLIWIASLCFAVLIAVFAVQNTALVTVWLLAWRVEGVAVSTLVLAAAALGALTTYLFGLSRGIRGRIAQRGSRATIRNQDALIEELRGRVRELERENERLARGLETVSRAGAERMSGGAAPIEGLEMLDSGRPESPALEAGGTRLGGRDLPPRAPDG